MPVYGSIEPIFQMVLLMVILLYSLVFSFWAMDPEIITSIDYEKRFFEVAFFLFSGEALFEVEKSFPTRVLGLIAAFMFLGCTMNVFIAVLSECYQMSQTHRVSIFMHARTRLCSDMICGVSMRVSICTLAVGFVCLGCAFYFSDPYFEACFFLP